MLCAFNFRNFAMFAIKCHSSRTSIVMLLKISLFKGIHDLKHVLKHFKELIISATALSNNKTKLQNSLAANINGFPVLK